MKIIYSPHLKRRIKERNFPEDYPRKIYAKTKQHFQDVETGHHIAIARLKYAKKLRSLVISYDIIGSNIEIITIHPISIQEIKKRIRTGRWIVKNEKN